MISFRNAIIIPALATAVLFFLTLYTSCLKDKCNNTVCQHGGVCVDANCSCVIGYEGSDCEKVWSDKFAGGWQADDSYIRDTSHTHFNYNVTVSGSGPDSFFVTGLSDSFKNVTCYRSSLNAFTLKPDQKLDSSITIQNGNGKLNTQNNAITGLYSFRFRGIMRRLVHIISTPGTAPKDDYEYALLNTDTIITVNFKWTR